MKLAGREKGDCSLDFGGDHSVKDTEQFLGYIRTIIQYLNYVEPT